jgi:hypothetical protein
LSTTNPTCSPDANSGRHGRKPATNRLSSGMAGNDYNLSGVRLSLFVLRPLLAYCTSPRCRVWRDWWNEDWQGKPKYSEKTCPSATLSTTNPTWLDPGSNPGRRDRKPATNRFELWRGLGSTITNQNLIREEIRGDWIRVMLVTIQSRTFCLLVCCLKTYKLGIQNYNFACDFLWVRNLVFNIKGGTQTEVVWEQDAEVYIWTEERRSDGSLEETA